MDTFSITPTLSPTAASPQGLTAAPSGTADAPPQGLSFGSLLGSLQPGVGRQDLAALVFGAGLPVPQLVSQPLGEALAVITADSPMPEQDSLLAFARSQGFDDAAIAALWQTPAAATAAAAPTAGLPQTAVPGAAPAGGMPALPALGTASPPQWLPQAGQPTTAPATPAASAAAPVVVMGLSVQGPAPTADPAAAPAPELDGLALQQMRASLQPAGQRGAPRPAIPTPPPTPVQAAAPLPRSGQEAALPLLDLHKDLAELAQRSENEASPLPEAPAPASGASAGHGSAALVEAPRAGPGSTPTANASAPQAVISGYQLKAEHFQQLAERMGQALAQRLQEQIDSGQWSMKLRLNPAELGQIDVQLDMHAGGLDARFQTENPLTKDLILQGSGRLKDSLNQHGTTVASVWVNSDDRRQSGGNPTPQQQQRRPSSGSGEARTDAVAPAPAQHNRRPEGWDMLA